MRILDNWNHILEKHKVNDAQYYEEYAKLYGCCKMFLLEDKKSFAFIIIKLDGEFNDFETPYGYGSFYTNNYENDFCDMFFSTLFEELRNKNIFAGLIRFNPLYPLPETSCFEFEFIRNVAVIDNMKTPNTEYSEKCRNKIRRADKCGLTFRKSESKMDYDKFKEIYLKKMKELNAGKELLFDKDYFNTMYLKKDFFKLFAAYKENEMIGGSIFIIKRSCISYYHLSAMLENSYKGANNLILDMGINESKLNGSPAMNLGGGITNNRTDSLLKFKMSFTTTQKKFHIGKIIIDNEQYKYYIDRYDSKNSKHNNYFLRYRYEKSG